MATLPARSSGLSVRYFVSGRARITRSLSRAATEADTAVAPGTITSTRRAISEGGRAVAMRTSQPALSAWRAIAVPTRPAPSTPIVRTSVRIDGLLHLLGHPEFRVHQRLDPGRQQFDGVQEVLVWKMTHVHLEELPHVSETVVQRQDALRHFLGVAHEQRTVPVGLMIVVGTARWSEPTHRADATHQRVPVSPPEILRRRRVVADEAWARHGHLDVGLGHARFAGRASIQLRQRRKPLGLPTDDHVRNRQPEVPGAHG